MKKEEFIDAMVDLDNVIYCVIEKLDEENVDEHMEEIREMEKVLVGIVLAEKQLSDFLGKDCTEAVREAVKRWRQENEEWEKTKLAKQRTEVQTDENRNRNR